MNIGRKFSSIEQQLRSQHDKFNVFLQAVLDAMPQAVSVFDRELRLLLWNRHFGQLLGFAEQMIFKGARFEDFLRFNALRGEYGPGDPEQMVQHMAQRARQFLPHTFERSFGNGRTLSVERTPFEFDGEIAGFVTTYADVTERTQAQEQIMRRRDELKTIIDNFPGAISLCDADLRFTAFNQQLIDLLEFPAALFAKGWVDFEDLIRFNVQRGEYGPGDPEQQVEAAMARAKNFQAHQIERMRPNGHWLEIRGAPIPSGGFVSSYIDITERKRLAAELEQKSRQLESLAITDRLTGLYNRSKFDEVVASECERATRTLAPLSLLMLDIDHFKTVNDSFGHQAGDEVLMTVAQLLRENVRKVDTVARWGGEEFMVLCPATVRSGACSMAEHVRAAVEKHKFPWVGHKTCSLGVAQYRSNEPPAALIERADAALYRAKNEGRNRVCQEPDTCPGDA